MKRLRFVAVLLPFLVLACGAEPAAHAVYRITGVAVSTRDGAPVPYCRMQIAESNSTPDPGARRPGGGDFGQRGRRQYPPEIDADARGRFQITLEHPGTYVLTGSTRDFRPQGFDAHESYTSSIVLSPATPTANIVFRMERDASIVGLVLDEAGEPVRNAQVAAESVSPFASQSEERGRFNRFGGGFGGGGFQSGFAQTDDRGHYELSGLTPGSYRVRVQAQPWYAQGIGTQFTLRAGSGPPLDPSLDVVYPTLWFPGVADEQAAEPIQLGAGEERQADFHLAPSPSVHLVVPRQDPPATNDGRARTQSGPFLTRISPAGGGFGQSITMNVHSQEFSGLTPGLYELRTFGSDGQPDPEAKQIRILPGSSGVLDLSSAETLTKVTLVYDGVDAVQAGQISFIDPASGRIINADGGLGGFGGRRRTEGDDAEREHSVYLPQGSWEVHLSSFSSTYLVSLQIKDESTIGRIFKVGDRPITLTLHLGSGRGMVSGIASLEGKPVLGAMVLLVPATLGEPGSIAEIQRDQTNTDGSFNLRGVVPGKYILLAIDHGWDVKWRDAVTLAGYLTRGVPVDVAPKAEVKRDLTALQP